MYTLQICNVFKSKAIANYKNTQSIIICGIRTTIHMYIKKKKIKTERKTETER